MQTGGACSKRVVRGDEPSSAGHGVSPVISSPGVVRNSTGSGAWGRSPSVVLEPRPRSSVSPVATVVPSSVLRLTSRPPTRPEHDQAAHDGDEPTLPVPALLRESSCRQPGPMSFLLSCSFGRSHTRRTVAARRAPAMALGRQPGHSSDAGVTLLAMGLVVQKFGGTSVADPDRIREVADHVRRTRRRGDDVVVVISAMGKETDELLRTAADVSADPPGREMDMLITAGERKATRPAVHGPRTTSGSRPSRSPAARPGSSPTPTT